MNFVSSYASSFAFSRTKPISLSVEQNRYLFVYFVRFRNGELPAVPACDDAHQPGAPHQGAAHPSPAGRLRTLRQDLQELLQHEGTPAHRARRLSEASLSRCTKIRNICQFVCDDVLICILYGILVVVIILFSQDLPKILKFIRKRVALTE
jgi:hypothetical protein